MIAILLAACLSCGVTAGTLSAEKAALREAKENYKTQMKYQGHYPEEAAELKQEYHDKVAAIKSEYQAKDDQTNAEPVMLASVDATSDEEKHALLAAKRNYKAQMQYQGHYPREAAELKQEYNHKVAAIKAQYQTTSDHGGAEPVILASAGISDEGKTALYAAKQNYKTQMQYQGHYPKEAAELKQEYNDKVAAIKSRYAGASNSGGDEPLLLASADESSEERASLRDAKRNYDIQMQYQGRYPKEAAELKKEYHQDVSAIRARYEVTAATATAGALVGIASALGYARSCTTTKLQDPLLHS